jgi:hypothetical protein
VIGNGKRLIPSPAEKQSEASMPTSKINRDEYRVILGFDSDMTKLHVNNERKQRGCR